MEPSAPPADPPAHVAPAAPASPYAPPVAPGAQAAPSREEPAPREPDVAPPSYYAATDFGPRLARERELCEAADHPDWLYLGATIAANVGTIGFLDGALKYSETPAVRLLGPASVGLTWGFFLGSLHMALPQCDATWAGYTAPPEGDVRSSTTLAIAMSLLAAASAPVIVAVETGPTPWFWPVPERSARVFVPMATGALGALLPYLLPPRPWRAMRQIEKLRLGGDAHGAFVGFGTTF